MRRPDSQEAVGRDASGPIFRPGFIRSEIITRVVLGIGILVITLVVDPVKRIIQPEDWWHYRFPYYARETFPERTAATLLIICPALFYLYFYLLLGSKRFSRVEHIRRLVYFCLTLSLSLMATVFISQVLKKLVGRLRPDFLSRCYNTTDFNKLLEISMDLETQPLSCSPDVSPHVLLDGRQSFPSAHSATSFSVFVVLAYWGFAQVKYLPESDIERQASETSQGTRPRARRGAEVLVTPVAILLIPTVIAVSRLVEYKHHATDIIAGTTLGSLVAIACLILYYPPGSRTPPGRCPSIEYR